MRIKLKIKNNRFLKNINTILHDSIHNSQVFIGMEKFLQADKILHVRCTRKHKEIDVLNYIGTISEHVFLNLSREDTTDINFIDIIMKNDIFEGYCSIKLVCDYKEFKDVFIFDIERSYLNELNQTERFLLFQRLQSFINLIYLGIRFKVDIKFSNTRKISHCFDGQSHIQALCKKFNITSQEFYYLSAISLIGSSKEIGQVIDKSPRTIEKNIQNLLEKYKINKKSQLQMFAKIICSHLKCELRM